MTVKRMVYVLQQAPGTAPVFMVGLLASLVLGSWWTSQAVVDGNLGSMAIRLTVSVVAGLYYYLLFKVCKGYRLKFL